MRAECVALYARVNELLRQGCAAEAALACKRLCELCPESAPAWYAGSIVARDLNNASKAFEYIDRAIGLSPSRAVFRVHKAQLLLGQRRIPEATALVAAVEPQSLDDVEVLGALGAFHLMMSAHERAAAAFERATQLAPQAATHWLHLAATYRFLGRLREAEQCYDRGLALDPNDFEACLMRAGLRKQTRERNHVEELLTALDSRKPDWLGEVRLCYSLAKELEDLQDHERSFAFLARGAALRRAHIQYDIDRDLRAVSQIIATFGTEVFVGSRAGCESEEPIFVVGLPRTGTTLVERILASHEQVYSAGELNNFALQLTSLLAAGAGGVSLSREAQIARSVNLDFQALGQRYVDSTRPHTGHTRHFVDKMPLNSLYCGLIALALPQARIIELVRDPMDTCYSIYKQLFTTAYPYSYDLVELGRYYLAHRRLMQHWHAILPGRIHRVRYEDLIGAQEAETRRLLEYCGLEWRGSCLRFDENPLASTTASAVQIRKPIYRSSIGLWKHYEAQLQPVAQVLRAGGIQL